MASILVSRWTKAEVFLVCLLPLAALGWRAWKQDLGANPIELITHATGDWAMRFLLITLAVTPLSKVLSMSRFTLFRRMLGLFACFYGCRHFLTYLWLDKFFDLSEISGDIGKRPFITIVFILRGPERTGPPCSQQAAASATSKRLQMDYDHGPRVRSCLQRVGCDFHNRDYLTAYPTCPRGISVAYTRICPKALACAAIRRASPLPPC